MLSLAEIAQLVEHFTRNEGVVGSSPIFGFDRERIKKRFCEGRGVFLCYYSQSFHSHAQKQSAKPSADASHLDFLLMWVK